MRHRIYIGVEEAEYIEFNGAAAELIPCGYYVDKSIKKYKLSKLVKGNNILIVKVPFGKRTGFEYCYLLGDFGVSVAGAVKKIIA